MSDIQTTDWNEVAASNNVTPPAGWPEGQAPSTVNDCAREMMGALKRDWDRNHATVTSGGTSSAFTLTYTVAPPAYVNGLSFRFKAHSAPAAAATMAPGSLTAKAINVMTTAGIVALSGGEWQAGHHVELEYDSGTDTLIVVNITASGAIAGNFAPTQQTTPNMTVAIAKGTIENYGTLALTAVAAQSTGTITAPVVNPRNDIVYIDQSTGVVGVVTGTPAASPSDPAMISGKLPIARIRLQITTTTITNSIIDDLRQLPAQANAGITALGVVGAVRNMRGIVASVGSTGTWQADEVIAETALGGTQYKLASYAQTLNVSTTGAGGMDVGSAPSNSFVSIYAIYNPTTNTQSILACNVTTSSGSIYSGANMPSGYTASALLSTWPTTSTNLQVCVQKDRKIWIPSTNILNITASVPTTYTSVTVTAIPTNATSFGGNVGSPNSSTFAVSLSPDPGGLGTEVYALGVSQASSFNSFNAVMSFELPLLNSQALFYKSFSATNPVRINVNWYTI
jgi:hypothetical protein